jgi:hypothetical protein
VAKLLIAAENPVIVAESYGRSQAAVDHLVELAELLQCGVNRHFRAHELSPPAIRSTRPIAAGVRPVGDADVILGLEVIDFWGRDARLPRAHHPLQRVTTKAGAKIISISSGDLYIKSNFQDFQPLPGGGSRHRCDGATTLPYLIEAVKRRITAGHKAKFAARGAKLAEAHKAALKQVHLEATYWLGGKPDQHGAALGGTVRADPHRGPGRSLVQSRRRQRLAAATLGHEQVLPLHRDSGGNASASARPRRWASRLPTQKHGRFTVTIQPDGDFMMGPGILWTAAHHKVPILYVMHNNRGYHQEVMGLQKMANRRMRGRRPRAISARH